MALVNKKGLLGKKPSKEKVKAVGKVRTKKLVSSLADRIFKNKPINGASRKSIGLK